MENFVHLHTHTEYSVLDGMCEVDAEGKRTDLVQRIVELGQPAVAMTDHGVMGGYLKFWKRCKAAKIKPIIGLEFYIVMDVNQTTEKNAHITCLAKDEQGFRNLIKLNNFAHREGFFKKARIDYKKLFEYADGLICMSACVGGHLPRLICEKKIEGAEKLAKKIQEVFGSDFYIEIMPHDIDIQRESNYELVRLAKKLEIQLVATNDAHYLNERDKKLHEIYLCIQTKDKLNNPKHFKFSCDGFYVRSRQEMIDAFKLNGGELLDQRKVEIACDNTVMVADSIEELDFSKEHYEMPKINLGEFSDEKELFMSLLKRKMKKKGLTSRPEYIDRLKMEYAVVKKLNFIRYFLIVDDICKYARKNGILMGVGRGSSAGSLICYLLGITNVDPIKYGLYFERFLNVNRKSMPDIDMDFERGRRQEIVDYIYSNYGSEYVSNITTYGMMKDKMVVKDISRVYDINIDEVNPITKDMFTDVAEYEKGGKWIDKSYEENDMCRRFFDKYPKVFKYSKRIEGLIRQVGVHPSGILITADKIDDIIPVERRGKNIVSAVSMDDIEELGLLKIDILGLNTLSVVNRVFKKLKIGFDNIDLKDMGTIKAFNKREYVGVFQFDSGSMRYATENFKFRNFSDLYLMNALDRPGTMRSGLAEKMLDNINKGIVKKIHPIYDEICRETYGIILYQEQVMSLFNKLGMMSLAESDEVRKVIAKSQGSDKINQYRDRFVDGCKKNGLSTVEAGKIFDNIVHFSAYSFNKAHSVSYSVLSFTCMYLKLHYPLQFMEALMSFEENDDKVVICRKECKRLGIAIMRPEINKSGVKFKIFNDKIIAGVGNIKGIGEKAATEILAHRPYGGFLDFYDKVNRRVINKNVVKILIENGAFRCVDPDINYEKLGIGKKIVAKRKV